MLRIYTTAPYASYEVSTKPCDWYVTSSSGFITLGRRNNAWEAKYLTMTSSSGTKTATLLQKTSKSPHLNYNHHQQPLQNQPGFKKEA